MAKETLRKYLNRMLKSKGTTASEEMKKASKYTSISAAKKAGSLYYTDKNGKVMAAVFGSDLKERIKGVKPPSPITVTFLDGPKGGRGDGIKETVKRYTDPDSPASMFEKDGKTIKPGPGPYRESARKKLGQAGMKKGGVVKKNKPSGYAKGGMPMVMKDGKKIPAYAADGIGKMNKGGMMKKPTTKMMAGGMAKKKPAAKMMAGGMAKKKPAAKMMGGGMAKKSSGYMYGGMAKKPAAKKK